MRACELGGLARRWYAFGGCTFVAEVVLTVARILIVEDDPLSGRTLAAIVRNLGYSVDLVTSVTAGLEHLVVESPACIFLDLMLPDGDGALILVRARATRSSTRIAVMTAIVDEVRLETLRRLGADRVYSKPVDAMDLIEWIETVMANSSDQDVRPPDDLPGLHLQ